MIHREGGMVRKGPGPDCFLGGGGQYHESVDEKDYRKMRGLGQQRAGDTVLLMSLGRVLVAINMTPQTGGKSRVKRRPFLDSVGAKQARMWHVSAGQFEQLIRLHFSFF
jgi:hypothetical protein